MFKTLLVAVAMFGLAQTAQARGARQMIAAANPYAAQAGLDMLARGGGAVDAAIAAQLVLNLIEPQSSGIGGGGFMLSYDARDGSVIAYDGRETAPAAVTPTLFLDSDGAPLKFFDAVIGGRAVGVPGLLAMLKLAHDRHGKCPGLICSSPPYSWRNKVFPCRPGFTS